MYQYNDIIIDSLDFCRREKGLEIWAYVIMSNHIHLLVSAKNKNLSSVIRDFKRYTAQNILKSIQNLAESRREWMLNRFELAAKSLILSSSPALLLLFTIQNYKM